MSDIRKHVESTLKNYTKMVQELRVLEFELDNLNTPLDSRAIESAVLSRPNNEWVSNSFRSDKTSDIVVDHIDSQRNAKYHALINLIRNMRLETRRLEHYLTLLPEEEADVIRWFYFEDFNWPTITAKALASQSTMQRRRRRGVERLAGFYSVLNEINKEDMRMKAQFTGYLHEEQYTHCIELAGDIRNPGIDAMLYIISGCNELWNAGPESFLNFKTGKIIPSESMTEEFSDNGAKLLRLAYCFAQGLELGRLLDVIRLYFPGLEHVHLELAIEAIRLALFSEYIPEN